MAVSLALAAGVGWLAWNSDIRLPDRWNPWAPLAVDDAPNILTSYKLGRLADDLPACHAVLEGSGLRYAPQPDRRADDRRADDRSTKKGCGWTGAVRITALPTAISQPFVLECPAAVALVLWERHSVQPLAQQHFGARVVRIDHLGSYACRNIGGETAGRRSEHASANAFDVAGFAMADGRKVRIDGDWSRDDARGRFLHDVHAGACRFWNVVLGPEYNAAHRDHLHLDLGRFHACR